MFVIISHSSLYAIVLTIRKGERKNNLEKILIYIVRIKN